MNRDEQSVSHLALYLNHLDTLNDLLSLNPWRRQVHDCSKPHGNTSW
jgi:hypothetical protein